MMMMMMLFATGHKTLANVATESISPSLLVKSAKQNGRTIVYFCRSESVCDRSCVYICTVALWHYLYMLMSEPMHKKQCKPTTAAAMATPTDRQRSKTERCQTNLEQRNKTSLLFAISLK